MQITIEGIFLPAEWEGSRRSSNADVHTDVASFDRVFELAGGLTTARKDAGSIALFAFVDNLHCLLEAISPHQRNHRAKDFFLSNRHIRGYIG